MGQLGLREKKKKERERGKKEGKKRAIGAFLDAPSPLPPLSIGRRRLVSDRRIETYFI